MLDITRDIIDSQYRQWAHIFALGVALSIGSPIATARDAVYRCHTDAVTEFVPQGQSRALPNEQFQMNVLEKAQTVTFEGSGYLNNYREPIVEYRDTRFFAAGRAYSLIAFDAPLLRISFFNRTNSLMFLAMCYSLN